MSKSTLESLPNELWLIIFSYLSSFDLCQTFLYINNTRIQSLLTSIHHYLNVNFIHYDQLHLWLNSDQNHRNRFTNMIDTVVLNYSCACQTLLEYWEKTFNETDQSNVLFASIKRLVVLQAEYRPYSLIQPILAPLVSTSNTLQYLHLIFTKRTYDYFKILSDLIAYRVSVHTMILEVEQGMI
ncbi:unnamed protein product [Adineta steineri]|nr:unnamed protein product [Adineta steineri]